MTLVSDILTAAFRETNIVGATASPTPTETTEALARLQALVLSSLGSEAGYIMEDWNIVSASDITRPNGIALSPTAGFTVKPNSRLMCNLSGATSLDLDPLPQDGQRVAVVNIGSNTLTLDGNGRLIDGGTTDTVASGAKAQYFYRSDLGEWVIIDPLAGSDEMPFPSDFDDYFVIMLAMRINPRYGRELAQDSRDRRDQQRQQFINRYMQSRLMTAPPSVGVKG